METSTGLAPNPYGSHYSVGGGVDHRDAVGTGIRDVCSGAVWRDGDLNRIGLDPYGSHYSVGGRLDYL